MKRIHITALENFHTCMRRYELADMQRITPVYTGDGKLTAEVGEDVEGPLRTGTIGHSVLQDMYNKVVEPEEGTRLWLERAIGKVPHDEYTAIMMALERYPVVYKDDFKRKALVETQLIMPFPDLGVEVVGHIDLMLETHKPGVYDVYDHKFYIKAKNLPVQKKFQFRGYLGLLYGQGYELRTFFENAIYKTPQKTGSKGATRQLVRTPIQITQDYIKASWMALREAVLAATTAKAYVPNFDWHCNYCPYNTYCEELLLHPTISRSVASLYRDKLPHER